MLHGRAHAVIALTCMLHGRTHAVIAFTRMLHGRAHDVMLPHACCMGACLLSCHLPVHVCHMEACMLSSHACYIVGIRKMPMPHPGSPAPLCCLHVSGYCMRWSYRRLHTLTCRPR